MQLAPGIADGVLQAAVAGCNGGSSSGGFYTCAGTGNFIKWQLPFAPAASDAFAIEATFKHSATFPSGSASVFVLWSGGTAYHLGFDGGGSRWFTEGGSWGGAQVHGSTTLQADTLTTMRIQKHADGNFEFIVDGSYVNTGRSMNAELTAIGFRPHRATIHVKELRMWAPRRTSIHCEELTVGHLWPANAENTKVVSLSQAGYICPSQVDRTNWLGSQTHSDTFMVTTSDTSVSVTRTGVSPNTGWGMNLIIACCSAPTTENFLGDPYHTSQWSVITGSQLPTFGASHIRFSYSRTAIQKDVDLRLFFTAGELGNSHQIDFSFDVARDHADDYCEPQQQLLTRSCFEDILLMPPACSSPQMGITLHFSMRPRPFW